MAFCPYCGTKLERDDQKFCTNCGAPFGAAADPNTPNQSQSYGYAADPNAQNQSAPYGYAAGPTVVNQAANAAFGGFSMKWYKFLIYFALWAGCVLNAGMGISYLSGNIYMAVSGAKVSAEMVYSVFPNIRPIDLIFGIMLIALGALQIVTRFQLAKFKKTGPALLYTCYAAAAFGSIVYSVIVGAIIQKGFDTSNMGTLILNAVMLICNVIYFSKRKSLFVNE